MKKIFLVSILLSQLTFLFGQNFRTADEMKNAIDLYIDLGYHINSCKERCDFDYCSRIFTTWYSQAPKDYYNQREDDITNAWEASKKSTFKSSTCDCGNFEKPNLNLGVKAQKQTETLNQVSSTITNAATLIDDALAQAKAQKKANQLLYNDLDDHELFEALITDVLIQFKKFGYNPTTPLTKIFSESNFKTYNSTFIEFKDFSISISWHYNKEYGESKILDLTCYNETTSNDIKNKKILNKTSCGKKSKITYYQTSDSKNKYIMIHSVADVDFTRNTVNNLNELIINTKEFKSEIDSIKKQQESVELKALADAQKEIADAGVEIPIETGKIVNESVTVKSIINNYITATGGSENINAVETITQIDDHNGNYRKTIKGYGKFLQEVTYKDRQYKFVFNGINGYSGNNGEKNPLSQENIIRYQKYQPFDILGLEQSTLRVGKIETIKGVDYYTIIEPSYQSGSLTVIKTNYFAVKSGLWKGFKLDFSSSNNNSSSYIFYNDFREVNHIVLPFSVISFDSYDKKSIDKTIVKEIIINEPNVSFE